MSNAPETGTGFRHRFLVRMSSALFQVVNAFLSLIVHHPITYFRRSTLRLKNEPTLQAVVWTDFDNFG